MEHLDLSHEIIDGMVTYPGLPGPLMSEHLTFEASRDHYASGTEFAIGSITMVGNTGTYLDTPAHRYRHGHDLAGLGLRQCVLLPSVCLDLVDGGQAIGPEHLEAPDLDGHAVLLHTGWDRHWGTATYGDPDHPFLSEAGAQYLVDAGVALVGIDSVNIDDTRGGERPAHTVLLGAGIPVVEHLTALQQLPPAGFRFTAVPPAVRGLATFPVRAFATVELG